MAYWEQDEERDWYCSECREEAPYEFRGWDKHGFMDYTPIYTMILSKYCPYCGAKMEYEKAYVPPPIEYTKETERELIKGYKRNMSFSWRLPHPLPEELTRTLDEWVASKEKMAETKEELGVLIVRELEKYFISE